MFQPLRACESGLGDLPKPTAPVYFFGVKLMFVVVVNFDQNKKIRFARCEKFLVMFNHDFWSSSFGQVN